jgi:murein DD-endopeptidase MepM/ murein hydrolase activator NlpD
MRLLLLAAVAGLAGSACRISAEPSPPTLELPIACELGKTCFIQQYMDHDPGPAARDYRCGVKVYDAHRGTDFRVPTGAAQRAGVEVRAAAAGRVRGVRDGMADRGPGPTAESIAGRECGNGLVIEHGDGWETQYCHMTPGSLRVKAGDAVAAGAPLGRVGQSGQAEFPHLHLSVRHAGKDVDPFAHGAAAGSCGGGRSLWSARAKPALAYRSPELINNGFATGAVTMEEIEADNAAGKRATATGPALTAFVRGIGLDKGDVQSLTLKGPDGQVLSESTVPALDRPKAQYMMFTGKRLRESRWPAGAYTARYVVRRGSAVVLDRTFETRL